MRIAFAEFSGWDFHAQSVDVMPMGGSQSAACHLARGLAKIGHEIFLITSTSSPGRYDGVNCLSWNQMAGLGLQSLKLDVLVCLLAAGNGVTLRQILGPGILLILWNQHAHDQPGVQTLLDPQERAAYDAFVMVSDWQRTQFQQSFGIEPQRMKILRNAIAPAFAGLFADDELILDQKAMPPVLAYTSTPFRGLDLLLDAFHNIRTAVPDARLWVFSSMRVYQSSAAEDERAYGALYQRCRTIEGIEYIGSLAQPELARYLRKVAVLSYPNTFAETSCIGVMEALAAGCRVVTSQLGALPETGAGFARLIPVAQSRESYLQHFVSQTVQVLRDCTARRDAMETELRRQVSQINQADTWNVRAYEWTEWLRTLEEKPTASIVREVTPSSGTLNIPQLFQSALQHHQAGRLTEAEAIYRQILTVVPHHADALHFLGVIAAQSGQLQAAAELMLKAIALVPTTPAFHSNLGEVYRKLGRADEAVAAYRRALHLKPDYAEAHNNVGNVLGEQGQHDEAIAAYRRALQLKPNYAEAYNNMGLALAGQAHCDEAIATYRRALQLKPDYAEAHHNLGAALREQGQLDDAVNSYRRALQLRPDYPEAHNNLGNVLKESARPDEAIAAYRSAIQLKPDYLDAHNNLAAAFKDQCQLEEAIAEYRRVLELDPDSPEADSNLLLTLHYLPLLDAATMLAEHRRWNRRHADPLAKDIEVHGNDRNSERRLRVGYVSPDFRDHVAGRYLLPLLERHDRERLEITCYSGVWRPDQMTERIRALASRWRGIRGVKDEVVAAMVRADEVDILVDLSQHMAGNRLRLFARHPAPVQVSYLGYPAGTGLAAIENRISDKYLEGDGAAAAYRSRERVYLIDSFWCYDPCGIDVAVNGLPAMQSGLVTFGCLNNFCKVNEQVLLLWARVLGRIADSRLVVLSPVGGHRQRVLQLLGKAGVEAARVEFVEPRPRREYLELYHRLDLVLDTFPYNGHTTNLDALWMGVPVVSLAGQLPVSRAGLSQLEHLPKIISG